MPDLVPVPLHRAVVASATRIQLAEGAAARTQVGKRQGWQADAWSYFQEIPEIKFGCLYLANALSRVTFFAGVESDDGTVIPIDDENSPLTGTALATAANAEMARLRGLSGGQGRINWLATLNSEVVGEFFIHGEQAVPERGLPGEPDYVAARPETWSVRSISQVTEDKNKSSGRPSFVLKGYPDDKGRQINPDTETLVRIWQEDPQWTDLADCHMRALLSDCELLTLLMNQQKAEAKSRQAPGILLVPSELSFAEDTAVDDGGDAEDQPQQNPFVTSLMKALTEPIEDPSAVSAVMPLVISAPKEYLTPDVFRLLSLARTSDMELDKRIDGRIQRLARGMNVPVEVIMGHQRTTFANAHQIDEDKFKDHVQPRCQMLADGYEFGFLVPNLAALGFTPDDMVLLRVGYETGVLTASPDPAENADAMWEAGVISQEAYRRLKGGSDDDAPDDQEVLFNLAARKGIFTSDLTTIVLAKGGIDLGVDVLAQGTIVPSDQPPAVTNQPHQSPGPVTGAVGRRKPNGLGQKLTDIDRQLFARIQGAVEAAMDRALERAGNRVKAKRGDPIAASARPIPARQVCDQLGLAAVTASGFSSDELLADAWDEFGAQFKLWVRAAGRDALEAVSRTLSGLTETQRDAQQLRLLTGVDEAWAWMENALGETGARILFHAERGAVTSIDALGEWLAEFRVPPGLIREAMALAGGATNMRGEAGILKSGDGTVVGGVATGDIIQDTIGDGGGQIDGYRWNYGPGRRQEFPPHAALDGVPFINFDDEVLANNEGWPEEAYYFPGDHDGCVVAGTMVSGPTPHGATLRHYEGEVVTVRSASGEDLTVTPNHPVLTRRGWVPAQLLEDGDEVVRSVPVDRASVLVPHDHEMPSRVEDVAAAFSVAPGVVACGVPVASVDFHGDGTDGEVCVVWADRLLVDRLDPTLAEEGSEAYFCLGYEDALRLTSDRSPFERVAAVGVPAFGGVSSGSIRAALVWGASGGGDDLRVASAAWLDADEAKPFRDRVPVDVVSVREGEHGLPAGMEFTKVIGVDRSGGFSGHVYNLSTGPGWYYANGIVVHNCLCDFTLEILTPDEAAASGNTDYTPPDSTAAADDTTTEGQG